MPIAPMPTATVAPTPPSEQWASASYYDILLANMVAAFIASGQYAPGPLIMQLALAATAEVMYQTGRWTKPPGINSIDLTPEEARNLFQGMRIR